MYKFQEKQAKDIFVDLYDSTTGLPYPGVPASGLVLKYAKAGESTYTTKVLTEGVDGNFAEIGDGVYKISVEEWVIGDINGGGPEMTFKSFNGVILIRKK